MSACRDQAQSGSHNQGCTASPSPINPIRKPPFLSRPASPHNPATWTPARATPRAQPPQPRNVGTLTPTTPQHGHQRRPAQASAGQRRARTPKPSGRSHSATHRPPLSGRGSTRPRTHTRRGACHPADPTNLQREDRSLASSGQSPHDATAWRPERVSAGAPTPHNPATWGPWHPQPHNVRTGSGT